MGILGGTFNPVHTGHLLLAQCAYETFDLSTLLFIPCAAPPHKDVSGLASAPHRLAMVEMAIEGDPRFEASDIEIRRGGISYAVDTVQALGGLCPDAALFFVVGSDTLPELHLWKSIYSLLARCAFVSCQRPGFDARTLSAADLRLDPPWPERLLENVARGPIADISSSDIRHRLAEGLSIRYLVPASVEMYIAEHRLYGS